MRGTDVAGADGSPPFNVPSSKRVWPSDKKSGAIWLRLAQVVVLNANYSAMETSNGLLASTFGNSTLSSPFLNSALIFPFSTPLPSSNERLNLP